jgi:hypothetical protein
MAEAGAYLALSTANPPAEVVGSGLGAIPAGLQRLRDGVSAKKLVVTSRMCVARRLKQLSPRAETGDQTLPM